MLMRDITSRLDTKSKQRLGEMVRFAIVGTVAVLIQYGIYLMLVSMISKSVAMTIAYIVSFCFNFIASTHYTFRVKANTKHGLGFALSHVVNYLLQIAMLNFFVWLGISKQLAPIPMFCVCVPTNFILVRFFLKR